MYFIIFLLKFLVIASFCIYGYDLKPSSFIPGTKTQNWKDTNLGLQINHNYSKVNYQTQSSPENGSSRYPIKSNLNIINPSYQQKKNDTNRIEKIVIRVRKQVEVFDKCPQSATGQFVYSLSCNQFLNCWKGRTFIQNCPPGTLFNPDTLSCDFPEKVHCLTGPRQKIYNELSSNIPHNLDQRDTQTNCPNDFSGKIPNYTNCSKFIICMNGASTSRTCPEGTLFDTNRNVCGHPNTVKCFNQEHRIRSNQNQNNVDYFVVNTLNNIEEGAINPYKTTTKDYYETKYNVNNDKICSSSNCRVPKHYPSKNNINDVAASTNKNELSSPVKCPNGFSGLHPHKYDCSKFLNCANGQTFVQSCGPGTLFDSKMMICNFDYNVHCVTEAHDNSVQSSTATGYRNNRYDEEIETTTTFRQVPRPTTRITEYDINSQTISQNIYQDKIYNESKFTQYKPNQIDQFTSYDNSKFKNSSGVAKVWPPPFPTTDTNADYVFEYYDIIEPVITDSENLKLGDQVDCRKSSSFNCNVPQKKCIFKNLVCNGQDDCPNGSDEKGCIKNLEKFQLHRNKRLAIIEKERWDNLTVTSCAYLCLESKKFDCKSFNYRYIDSVCFLSDLNEGLSGRLMAYEPNDYYELKTSTINCTNNNLLFKCNNNKCINKSQVCDGQNDCTDREDEKHCIADQIGYKIRLTGGKNQREGNIQVEAYGKIGFICDDRFDIKDGNVVCKELGYPMGAAAIKSNSFFAQDIPVENIFYLMDDVVCQGNETSIKDCDFNGWGINDCTKKEVVGVICKTEQDSCPEGFWKCKTSNECVPIAFVCDGPEDCADGSEEDEKLCNATVEVRLVNGSNIAEGRVEVKYHGIWGTVCDDDFNDDAAKVVCKSLGFKGTTSVKKDSYFGNGKGPIWLDQVTCFGNETKLEECTHWNWGEHNCDHNEDVGVVCNAVDDTKDIEKHARKSENINMVPIYPSTCGLRKYSLPITDTDSDVHFRVVKGSKAKKGDFPWQAALRVKGKLHLAHWCGAVVISSKFVITAAHCLVGYPKGAYVVVAGDYNVDIDEGTEQYSYIEDYYIHEEFRKGHKMNNDIALIKLKGNGFNLNQDVQAICLPDENTDLNIELNCTISGFGSIESGTSAFSNELRAGKVPLQLDSICKMPHVYGSKLSDGMFCAGTMDGGTDSCDGDSGGPLACLDEGLYTLYGITSWGQRCGFANKPGVYVKVAHYRKWIDRIMKKNI